MKVFSIVDVKDIDHRTSLPVNSRTLSTTVESIPVSVTTAVRRSRLVRLSVYE
ncbi:hypothetical protein CHU_1363 [Cytophaga hutchinsonii ATCC 33406]|uniref:Uncharacterized protein n=1 Tax=Cytophaga hutchinsonii (strain ATCC 33406 / DSM 1761 / CIP 103989 / NBRC 15051 / NCIMB 9469 / D465) TaxID=269798 RepID=A0A6N4SQS1_CYTH3|nr:hypothetical protein CHU_1363 [Cytophaga hutchinsonii ATCC 33406]